jgi:hypothetical protein
MRANRAINYRDHAQSLTPAGTIRYRLKTPYRDGTTDILFEPLDFIARLAALVPKPRVNLTRFHGVFAPNSHWRAQITPAGRGRGRRSLRAAETPLAGEQHRAMSWAQRLKRVFGIDVETCARCGGPMKVIASIEDPAVIKTILAHLDKATHRTPTRRVLPPAARAPPAARPLLRILRARHSCIHAQHWV